MDIGKISGMDNGPRKDQKVEAAKTVDSKKVVKKEGSGSQPSGAPSSVESFASQDSVSFSRDAAVRSGEIEGWVQQIKDEEASSEPTLSKDRIEEIRDRLQGGHYQSAAVLEAAARRIRSGQFEDSDMMGFESKR